MKRTPLKADPAKVSAFHTRARLNAKRTHRAISPASPEQREKVRDRRCVECGHPGCDPAHITPRSLGGCDHPDCVIPLCRTHHRMYDAHELDLEPVLALAQFVAERSHMATHMSLRQCIQQLNGYDA